MDGEAERATGVVRIGYQRHREAVVDEVGFTAGITFQDDSVVTVDVSAIDGEGIAYVSEDGPGRVRWADVKAVMLATTDHMLESAGSLFTMAERLEDAADDASAAAEMRRFGVGLLRQAAPRMCPLGGGCALARTPGNPPG
jgi:hypothetical protein